MKHKDINTQFRCDYILVFFIPSLICNFIPIPCIRSKGGLFIAWKSIWNGYLSYKSSSVPDPLHNKSSKRRILASKTSVLAILLIWFDFFCRQLVVSAHSITSDN